MLFLGVIRSRGIGRWGLHMSGAILTLMRRTTLWKKIRDVFDIADEITASGEVQGELDL